MNRPVKLVLVTLALVVCGVGCKTTTQARKVEEQGFLRDYSKLKPGKGDEPLLFYVKPDVDLSSYDKMIVAPVTLWKKEGSDLAGLSDYDLATGRCLERHVPPGAGGYEW